MKNKKLTIIIVVLLIGFFLRFISGIKAPLVPDEYEGIIVVKRSFFKPIWNDPLIGGHPPLHFYILRLSASILSNSKISYRFPQIIFGTITIFIIYKLSLLMFKSKNIALLSMILWCINPFLIGFSRQIAHISGLLFFATLFLYFFWKLLYTKNTKLYYLLSIIFLLGFFYKETMILVLVFCYAFLFFHKKFRRIINKDFYISNFIIFILLLPFIIFSMKNIENGMIQNISKLSLIPKFSFAPIVLYVPILFNLFFHPNSVSELPLNDDLFGILIIFSVFFCMRYLRKKIEIKFNFLFFCFIILFFTWFSNGAGEYWWADLSMISGIILTAFTLTEIYKESSYKTSFKNNIIKSVIFLILIVLVVLSIKFSFSDQKCYYSKVYPPKKDGILECQLYVTNGQLLYGNVVKMNSEIFYKSIYYNITKYLEYPDRWK